MLSRRLRPGLTKLDYQNVAEMATLPEEGNTTERLALAAASLGTAILESLQAHPPALVRGTVGERGLRCATLPLTQVGERSLWCARGHPLQ